MRSLTSLTPRQTSVILDCTTFHVGEESGGEIDTIIDWVQQAPSSSAIHVYLRSFVGDRVGRKIKNTLQAMGCTVTQKTSFTFTA